MIESLYLTIQRGRWNQPRIAAVSKRRPKLKNPSEQSLVRIDITVPDDVLNPRAVKVVIGSEHLQAPLVTVQAVRS